MTGEEWLSLDRVNSPVMNWLSRRGTRRQFYLLAAGFVRQVEDRLSGQRFRALITLAEDYADGLVVADDVARAVRDAENDVLDRIQILQNQGASLNLVARRVGADLAAVRAATPPNGWMAAINALKDAGGVGKRAERSAEQAALLRDIFGNPFRPVAFDPAWRTSTAVALAQQMYDSRDFGIMPILGDALQDAGCDSDDILDHCRGPGPHVRGCWVVDLVLRKA
jgi:hypothetical protein